ncbi:MAG: hypothetical protein OXD46_04300 [Chloroflexi bacterium]|nr:hypothetical protein [Chloroflexota bacterium]
MSTAALWRRRTLAACILLAASLLACSGGSEDSTNDRQLAELEAKASSLEESLNALTAENAGLKREVTSLRGHLDDRDARLRELEEIASKMESAFTDKEEWSKSKTEWSLPEGDVLERTVSLVENSGGEVHYVDHPGRGDRTVLVTPREFVDGETPLIVSLHGFGGDSAYQATYVPLHERVNTDGFALLLPNGALNAEGIRFWNPTDECCDGGKSGEDDVSYLTELVADARRVGDFGPVYFFGYSNGGFMSHHMACKGLPGLRAVASLAGTSYVEDSSCDGAPPVSVLHIHGTEDSVILFDGDATESDPKSGGEAAFYAGARDMVTRWSQRAGCDWPEDLQPYATLDLDHYVPGPETQAFRLESGCADGISIELWMGVGSGHSPDYGDGFIDALLEWLLSQE